MKISTLILLPHNSTYFCVALLTNPKCSDPDNVKAQSFASQIVGCCYTDLADTTFSKTHKINSKYSGIILLANDFLWKHGNAKSPVICRAVRK